MDKFLGYNGSIFILFVFVTIFFKILTPWSPKHSKQANYLQYLWAQKKPHVVEPYFSNIHRSKYSFHRYNKN